MAVTHGKGRVLSTAAGTATVAGTVTANQGTANSTANRWPVQITDGTDLALVTAAGEQNVIATAQPGIDIGDVTINNASGTSSVFTQGPHANGVTVTANPVLIGAVNGSGNTQYLETSTGALKCTLVESSFGAALPGDPTYGLGVDIKRTVVTATTVSTDTEVSVTGSSTQLLAANSSRKKVFIQNHGTGYVRVRLAASALTTSPIRLVPEVGTYELKSEDGYVYRGVINAISETGTNLVGVIEET